jgi:hypothetical protein
VKLAQSHPNRAKMKKMRKFDDFIASCQYFNDIIDEDFIPLKMLISPKLKIMGEKRNKGTTRGFFYFVFGNNWTKSEL